MPSYDVPPGAVMRTVAMLALAAALAGCAAGRDAAPSPDATGSIAGAAGPARPGAPRSQAELRAEAALWQPRHDADPGDPAAAIAYAQALRGLTRYAQAAAVLETAAVQHPYDRAVLGAYGKALADAGRPREAMVVLGRAHTPDAPDWSVLSAQGSVAEALGDHAGALDYYQAALKIRPDEPTILSNLGLAYALNRQLPEAEDALRAAAASPAADARVRQNYALVLSLEGKFAQAEAIAATDLPRADAAASVGAIRRMIATDPRWRAAGRPAPGDSASR